MTSGNLTSVRRFDYHSGAPGAAPHACTCRHTYNGTPLLTAADAAHFTVTSTSPRYSFSVVDPSTTYPYVKIHVTGNAANLIWRGAMPPAGEVGPHHSKLAEHRRQRL